MDGQRQDDEQASESGCDVITYVHGHVAVSSLGVGVTVTVVGVAFRVLEKNNTNKGSLPIRGSFN